MENSDPHTSNDSNGSAADNDGHISGEELARTKEDNGEIVSKLKELFGGETITAFEAEELLTKDGIDDLLNRDADAPIFTRLGLNYGKAVRFKSEMSKLFPQRKIVPGKNEKPTNVKPRMEDIVSFSPEQKSTYLLKRKRVGVLAATKWKGAPKFNSPTMKAELVEFAAEVAPQCAMPEVGFNEEGIMKHVQSYFNEQRRYRRHKSDCKGKCSLTEDQESNLTELSAAKSDSDDSDILTQRFKASEKSDSVSDDSDMSSKSKRFKASQKGSDTNNDLEETKSLAESDDGTASLDTSTESSKLDETISEDKSPGNAKPSVSQLRRASASGVQSFTLTSYQMIIKAVFGENLNRENIVKMLKNKFSVKHNSLTSLTVSQLMEVIAKKLLSHNYCHIGLGVNPGNMKVDDIIVYKEISL